MCGELRVETEVAEVGWFDQCLGDSRSRRKVAEYKLQEAEGTV
jgi:hypothetical protein